MDPREVIAEIKTGLDQIKQSGQSVIAIDALIKYLDEIEVMGVASDRFVEHAHAKSLAYYEADHNAQMEVFRSVITSGQAALKSAILINGGAAVALLAFIGNVWDATLLTRTANGLTNSITQFALGVLSASMGSGANYLTQFFFSDDHMTLGNIFNILSILLVIAAYVLFASGVYEAYTGFIEHMSAQASPSASK